MCVANFIPPANGASQGKYFLPKSHKSAVFEVKIISFSKIIIVSFVFSFLRYPCLGVHFYVMKKKMMMRLYGFIIQDFFLHVGEDSVVFIDCFWIKASFEKFIPFVFQFDSLFQIDRKRERISKEQHVD